MAGVYYVNGLGPLLNPGPIMINPYNPAPEAPAETIEYFRKNMDKILKGICLKCGGSGIQYKDESIEERCEKCDGLGRFPR